jgi:hypothetical protein
MRKRWHITCALVILWLLGMYDPEFLFRALRKPLIEA